MPTLVSPAPDPGTPPSSVTPALVAQTGEQNAPAWRDALPPDSHPRLGFAGKADFAATVARLAAATDGETVRRREDLRRVVDEIMDERWLRVYDHHPSRRERNAPLLGFPVPVYRTPDELTGGTLIAEDARRELWQRDVGDCLPALALAAHLFPGRAGEYRERLRAFALSALDYPTWGAQPTCRNMDLAADHLARGIAVAYDWHPDLWTDAEKARLRDVMREKVGTLLRGAYGAAFWARGWRDNHCQNAFATLGICGACFLDEIPDAAEWLGAAVAGFDIALPRCNADGSSTEGVPYWGYGLTFLLQYIEWTGAITGARKLYDAPYLQNAAQYRLHCSLPDLSGIVTFGDANLQDYYGPSHLLYALARHYRDGAAQGLGDHIPFANRSGADIETCALLWRDADLPALAPADLPLDYYLAEWDVATTRNGWEPDDYVLAVKSGFNCRSHSHLDAGCLLFGWGDEWLIDAPGYGLVGPGFWEYGGPRWEYYSNRTESHTTLLIGGANQRFDRDARATIVGFDSVPQECVIAADLTGAYHGVLSVRRWVQHARGSSILILDTIECALDALAPVEWLLQPGRDVRVEAGNPPRNVVTLHGRAGSVRVEALAQGGMPAPVFRPRTPLAAHVDVPPDAVRTLALYAPPAPRVTFEVLLTPLARG